MSCGEIHAFTHVLKTCHRPTLNTHWGQIQQEADKQGPGGGVHVIWLQELMVTLGRTVSREAEGESEEWGQGDRED